VPRRSTAIRNRLDNAAVEPHPIRLVVRDDLERSRLTVFFRLLLLIPHVVWLFLWSLAAFLVAVVNWVATLVSGRPAGPLWEFLAAYLRYGTHVYAYGLLAANPFPGFTGAAGSYPVDLEIAPPERQSRWKTAFRLVLVIPALILGSVLLGGPGGGGGGGGGGDWEGGGAETGFYVSGAGLAFSVAFFAWFACLVRARMPHGFRDLLAYALRYSAQTWGYLLLVTDRYPDADPADPPAHPPPPRAVALTSEDDDLRRSRLTVFFRLLLAFPHLVWLVLWAIVAVLALVAGWLAALVLGRLPSPLHRFLAAFLRYDTHVFAFLFIVGNPFPGFTGAAGSYPVDVHVDPPEPQRRWTILFRLPLALPALVVNSGLGAGLVVAAFLGWFAALLTGRMPRGLRGLGAYALGYNAQTYGYVYLLTGRYPYSGPPGVDAGAVEEEAAPPWPDAPLPPSPSF
jgi:hypothetical protein